MDINYPDILGSVARDHNVSTDSVEGDMAEAIHAAFTNPDPLIQGRRRLLFGDTEPTPERFIATLAQLLPDVDSDD